MKLKFNTMGEDIQSIMMRGYILSQMFAHRSNMTDEEKEAVDFFRVASYSTDNPPNGFSAKTWAMVEAMGERKEQR